MQISQHLQLGTLLLALTKRKSLNKALCQYVFSSVYTFIMPLHVVLLFHREGSIRLLTITHNMNCFLYVLVDWCWSCKMDDMSYVWTVHFQTKSCGCNYNTKLTTRHFKWCTKPLSSCLECAKDCTSICSGTHDLAISNQQTHHRLTSCMH